MVKRKRGFMQPLGARGSYGGKRRRTGAYAPFKAPARRYRGTYNRNVRTGGFVGIESKFLDCAWNQVTILSSTDGSGGELQPSSGCTDCISVPAQGDGESARDGRKYVLTSAWVSGTFNMVQDSDNNDVGEGVDWFIALVLDTQANAATIVSENVYINPSTQETAMFPQPLRNLQNSKRFKILASQFVPGRGMYASTDGTATCSLSQQNRSIVNLSWKGKITCDSKGTTADIASATDNALHVIAYATDADPLTKFTGKSRVRFQG
uniref:hypothetical protein n=1 Tax=Roseivirga sp. TaxID=1964215 RepID=UPI004047FF69